MYGNPLTGEAIVSIVNSLEGNNTLELLWLSMCPEDIKKRISSLQEVINEKRESRELVLCKKLLMRRGKAEDVK